MKRKFKQSTLTFIINTTSIVLLVFSVIAFFLTVRANTRVDAANLKRHDLIESATQFLDGSATLTSEVRAYSATGNRQHYDNYWREVYIDKNRDIGISRMKEIGITKDEEKLVEEMSGISNDLIPLEEKAMKLAEEGKISAALAIVYGTEYEKGIASIRELQAQFVDSLSLRTQREVEHLIVLVNRWIVVMILCLVITAISQVFSIFIIQSRIIRPIVAVRDEMQRIAMGDLHSEFDVAADTSEIGMMIASIQITKAEVNKYIQDISDKLEAIASGELDTRIETEYIGDFAKIKITINAIAQTLKEQYDRDILSRDQLQKAYDDANAANQAKSNFLANMSHEIRTPMNAIIGMTNIAVSSNDPDKIKYCLKKINDASAHLLGVINDILDMSKIEANKLELSPVEFELEKMLAKVMNVVHYRADEKNQHLNISIDPEVPAMVIADEQRLTQVITNLFSNAIKFTPEAGQISLKVELLAEDNSDCKLLFKVKDTGIGLSKEQQQRLFQTFSQADDSISRRFGGTGLGLAISKSIVEKMNGRIWIESEEGDGATFLFTVHVIRGQKLEATSVMSSGEVSLLEKGSDTPDFSGKHILLAEDVEINREIVLTLLEPTKATVTCVENGLEAVAAVADNPQAFDIIFMDVHMPEMDGNDATRSIRALNDTSAKEIPIIAMTANVFKEDVERCLMAGMNGHIGKPLDFDEVIEVLRQYLL